MRTIVAGKRYDTENAERICRLPCNVTGGDFSWHETDLFVTKNGAFFVAGEGNAYSIWGKPAQGSKVPGHGGKPVSREEALQHLEDAGEYEVIERYFEVVDA